MTKYYEIRDSFLLDVMKDWGYRGINVAEAVKKQQLGTLEKIEDEDGTDENGRPITFIKEVCPDCKSISYSGRYCLHCGKRVRP